MFMFMLMLTLIFQKHWCCHNLSSKPGLTVAISYSFSWWWNNRGYIFFQSRRHSFMFFYIVVPIKFCPKMRCNWGIALTIHCVLPKGTFTKQMKHSFWAAKDKFIKVSMLGKQMIMMNEQNDECLIVCSSRCQWQKKQK